MTEGEFESWLDAYGAAWETRSPDAVVELFTADASYRVTPFREPHRGRAGIHAYWSRATGSQSDVRFESDVLAIAGPTGIAGWRASFRDGERPVELDGVFVLSFAGDGRCRELREWWHAKESA